MFCLTFDMRHLTKLLAYFSFIFSSGELHLPILLILNKYTVFIQLQSGSLNCFQVVSLLTKQSISFLIFYIFIPAKWSWTGQSLRFFVVFVAQVGQK